MGGGHGHEALQVGVTTVRTHIRNLFAKTGTSRQAELVSRLMSGH